MDGLVLYNNLIEIDFSKFLWKSKWVGNQSYLWFISYQIFEKKTLRSILRFLT